MDLSPPKSTPRSSIACPFIEDLGGGNPPENASIKGIAIVESDDGGPPTASLKPGDINADGSFNITDMVAQLNFLFGGGGGLPECYVEQGGLSAAGLAINDYNGDGSINITDAVAGLDGLFAGGGAHVLGRNCADIKGSCTSNCTQ